MTLIYSSVIILKNGLQERQGSRNREGVINMKGLNSEWITTIDKSFAKATKGNVSINTKFDDKLGTLEMTIAGIVPKTNKTNNIKVAFVGDYKESVKDYLEIGSFECIGYHEVLKDLVTQWLAQDQ